MKNLKHLALLFALILSVTFAACSKDDDNNGGTGDEETTVTPGGDNGTTGSQNGTSGKFIPGYVNGKYLTGIGEGSIEYDVEGRVIKFTDNGYFGQNYKYNVTYNPFEINLNAYDGEIKIRMHDVEFTKEGYIKSAEVAYEYEDGEKNEEEWSLTYKDSRLTKIAAKAKYTENYDGEEFSYKGNATFKLNWENGNITDATSEYKASGYGITEESSESYSFTYGNRANTSNQFTPATTFDFGEDIEILLYLGYFGKATNLLPETRVQKLSYNDVSEYGYDTEEITTTSLYSYTKNEDGTLNLVTVENNEKTIRYLDGEVCNEYEYTSNEYVYYSYDNVSNEDDYIYENSPMKAKQNGRGNKRFGLLRR